MADAFVLNGQDYRIGEIPSDQLPRCQALGTLLARRMLGYNDTCAAVAEIIAAMLVEHHPEVTAAFVLPCLTRDHVYASGRELTRQLLAAVPTDQLPRA